MRQSRFAEAQIIGMIKEQKTGMLTRRCAAGMAWLNDASTIR